MCLVKAYIVLHQRLSQNDKYILVNMKIKGNKRIY